MSKPVRSNETVSLGQLIEDVTLPNCQEELMIIMHICDVIKSTVEGPREAAKSIRKRFATRDQTIIKLTLALLDTCVKNCGLRFHIQIAQRDFLQDFIKIIKPKNNASAEVQMKVLGLLQSWAFAFQDLPELREVNKIYQDLKSKNVQFPPIDENDSAQLRIAVQDTSSVGDTYLAAPQSSNTSTSSGGASYLIVPQSSNAYARLSPSGGRHQRPPKSPLAERRHSKESLGEGIHSSGASYLIVPQTSNAHARLSPGGIRKQRPLPSPSAERKPLTTDGLEEPAREGVYSSGASYLIVPHTYDAHARLSPSGTRRAKPAPSPSAERRPSKTDALGESSLIAYERLASSDSSLQEAERSVSSSPSVTRGEPVSTSGGCRPDQQ